jgi:heme oxygenase
LPSPSTPEVAELSVVSMLRERTRPLHDQTEAGIDLQRALSSCDEYRRMLAGYLGLYRPFEAALSQASHEARELVDWPASGRVPLLERDLLALGSTQEEIAAMPNAPVMPDLTDPSAMLGALYVVEGSQLGGQMIYRDVQSKLHLDVTTGASFFAGAGTHTGPRWKQFLSGLEQQTQDTAQAVEAACAMFHYFGAWLKTATQPQEKS